MRIDEACECSETMIDTANKVIIYAHSINDNCYRLRNNKPKWNTYLNNDLSWLPLGYSYGKLLNNCDDSLLPNKTN